MLNQYRLAGDCIHLLSFIGLIYNILRKRSCASLSVRTQILLALTFILRYADLFTTYISLYNTVMKVGFILSTLLLVYLISFKFKSTNDLNHDQFRVELILLPTALITFALCWFDQLSGFSDFVVLQEVFWRFSIYLEAFAFLPQLYLVLKKGNADVSVAYYVAALWFYRMFYMMNWYYRYVHEDVLDMISIGGGCIQVVTYSLFFCMPVKYQSSGNTKQEEAKLYVIESPPDYFPEKVGLHDMESVKEPSKILQA